MKLVKLSSSNSSFRTVNFNQNGLTIILGTHNKKSSKSTYNGVGKSLALFLVQFCLGSKSNKVLTKKLPDWTFHLDFSIKEKQYRLSRNTSNQNVVFLDEMEYSLDGIYKKLLGLIFTIDPSLTKPSFRSLISRFLRTRKNDYLKYDNYVYKEQEDRALLSNSILLGLQSNLVESKFLLKEEYNKISNLRKTIQADEIFSKVFGIDEYDGIKIKEIEDEVLKLSSKLKDFQIAHDYRQIESIANQLSYQMKIVGNNLSLLEETKNNIIKSLEVRSDINMDDINSLVQNVNIELGIDLKDKLEKVQEFHSKLVEGRQSRLNEQLNNLEKEISKEKSSLEKITYDYNNNLKYLNTFGALDDYVSITQLLNDKNNILEKVRTSIELIDQYKRRESEIKLTLAEENLTTEDYLQKEREGILQELMDKFRSFTGRFYENKKGGINVFNNEGDNKLRYNIEVKIQDDTSDGINEVKLFCFDLLLLTTQKNHNVKFLFHDSRLYANMDTHQRFVALSMGNELHKDGFQYIVSMNQDTLDILKSERTESEFNSIINESSLVLELDGETDANRLLGIHVDLNYE